MSVPVANKLLSSVQLLKVLKQMKRNKSFLNKLKKSGSSIEPCGTPASYYFFQAAKFIVALNSLSSVLQVTTHET